MAFVTADKFMGTEMEILVMEALDMTGVLTHLNKDGYIVTLRGVQTVDGLMDTDPRDYEAEIRCDSYISDYDEPSLGKALNEQVPESVMASIAMMEAMENFRNTRRKFKVNPMLPIYTLETGAEVVGSSVYLFHRLSIKLIRGDMDENKFVHYMMQTIANTVLV